MNTMMIMFFLSSKMIFKIHDTFNLDFESEIIDFNGNLFTYLSKLIDTNIERARNRSMKNPIDTDFGGYRAQF